MSTCVSSFISAYIHAHTQEHITRTRLLLLLLLSIHRHSLDMPLFVPEPSSLLQKFLRCASIYGYVCVCMCVSVCVRACVVCEHTAHAVHSSLTPYPVGSLAHAQSLWTLSMWLKEREGTVSTVQERRAWSTCNSCLCLVKPNVYVHGTSLNTKASITSNMLSFL